VAKDVPSRIRLAKTFAASTYFSQGLVATENIYQILQQMNKIYKIALTL
jgi:hypothetical protein